MSVVDGVLEDDLAPLATHVYIIRPMLKHDDVHASAPQVSLTWLLAKPEFVDVHDATPPILFWASYPVLPNETVMLAGGGFERTTIASSQVRVVPLTTPAAAVTVRPSQVTAGTVKVVLPVQPSPSSRRPRPGRRQLSSISKAFPDSVTPDVILVASNFEL